MIRDFLLRERWQRNADGSLVLNEKGKSVIEKRTGKDVYVTPPLEMANGSLVVFDADVGKNLYKHSVPKAKKDAVDVYGLGRFNITFRTTASASSVNVPTFPATEGVGETVAREFLEAILRDPLSGYAAVRTCLLTRTGDIPTDADLEVMAMPLTTMFETRDVAVAIPTFQQLFISPPPREAVSLDDAAIVATTLLVTPDLGYMRLMEAMRHINGARITPESLMETAGPILEAMFVSQDATEMAAFIHQYLLWGWAFIK